MFEEKEHRYRLGSEGAQKGEVEELLMGDDALIRHKIATLPRINIARRQLYDLELLMNRGFSPLYGFLDEEDYLSVAKDMRLSNGTLWPIPIVLDIKTPGGFEVGREILLCDEYGKPLAVFVVSSVYKPDKVKEAEYIYGTKDMSHPGVRYLFEEMGDYYAGGKIYGISFPDQYDFHELRFSPKRLKEWFRKHGWQKIVGFQTRNPLHRAHFEIIKRAAEEHGANVLLHPVVGLTKEDDIDYITRVRCYQKLHKHYMSDFAKLSLLPLAMRMAGPREALWHALIRKNYGCTHFIVGRDHAGPKDSAGRSFYGPYAAQALALRYEPELGIGIIPVKEMVYVVEKNEYMPMDSVDPAHTVKNISGTEVRQMLVSGEEIPSWFSFPEVVEELRKSALRQQRKGFTVFFTGLPSAGKSTIANILHTKLLELQDRNITLLDGDVVRNNLSKGLGFSREDRDVNIERIGFVAGEVTKHGGIALCAAIAPFEEARAKNRRHIQKYGPYIEVYVSTPVSICRERDVKGLYKKAEAGVIQNFTGVNDPYEIPQNSEIVLDTLQSPLECAERIIAYLRGRNLLASL